jgi:hypothetical protein
MITPLFPVLPFRGGAAEQKSVAANQTDFVTAYALSPYTSARHGGYVTACGHMVRLSALEIAPTGVRDLEIAPTGVAM